MFESCFYLTIRWNPWWVISIAGERKRRSVSDNPGKNRKLCWSATTWWTRQSRWLELNFNSREKYNWTKGDFECDQKLWLIQTMIWNKPVLKPRPWFHLISTHVLLHSVIECMCDSYIWNIYIFKKKYIYIFYIYESYWGSLFLMPLHWFMALGQLATTFLFSQRSLDKYAAID